VDVDSLTGTDNCQQSGTLGNEGSSPRLRSKRAGPAVLIYLEAQLKRYAKSLPGSVYVEDRRKPENT